MRIDAYNQVSQLYQATKPKKVSGLNETKKTDQCQISQSGKDYQAAKNAISQMPDVREEKVQSLKEEISSGTYNVSAQEIAEAMTSRFFDSLS